MPQPSVIAGGDVQRFGVAAAVLISYVDTAGELGQTRGPSLLKPTENFNFKWYSRRYAILFSKQLSRPSSVWELTAVRGVCEGGLTGHGGDLSRSTRRAPLRVLVLAQEEWGGTAATAQVVHRGTPAGDKPRPGPCSFPCGFNTTVLRSVVLSHQPDGPVVGLSLSK